MTDWYEGMDVDVPYITTFDNVIGITKTDWYTNQTRSTRFKTENLLAWAYLVHHLTPEDTVTVKFTPDRPACVEISDEYSIGVAPVIRPDEEDE